MDQDRPTLRVDIVHAFDASGSLASSLRFQAGTRFRLDRDACGRRWTLEVLMFAPRGWTVSLFATVGALLVLSGPTATRCEASPSDGTWTVLPAGPMFGHAGAYDPVRDRMVFYGGTQNLAGTQSVLNHVWQLDLSGPLGLTLMAPAGTAPQARYAHTMVYDPVRDRMLIFGGYTNAAFLNDVWALSLSDPPTWTQLAPSGALPTPRHGHVAVYDPLGDRMVIFGGGGNAGTYLNDVWSLALSGSPAWESVAPANTPPLPRRGASAIYDAATQRMVMFGGYRGTYLGDVWELSLSGSLAWTQVTTTGTGPTARAFQSATYDAGRGEMIVHGGSDGSYKSDAFALSLAGPANWAAIPTPGGGPIARGHHTLVRDPVRDREIVFAGLSSTLLDDLWALSRDGAPEWTVLSELSEFSPFTPRSGACVVLDAPRDRLILFGGTTSTAHLNDLWELPLDPDGMLRPLVATGTPPSAKYGRSAIYDPVRERMILFGGNTGVPGGASNEAWELSLSGTPAWQQLAPLGGPPLGRWAQSSVYRPAGDEMIVFGGLVSGHWTSETWRLSLTEPPTWSQLGTYGSPTGRYAHTAIFDPVGDAMFSFGGDPMNGETWKLSFGPQPVWTLIANGDPSPRYGATAIYDPLRRRGVLFGGVNGLSYPSDVWELRLTDGPGWIQLFPDGAAPVGRIGAGAVYDPLRDRMVVLGGSFWTGSERIYPTDIPSLQWSGILDAGSGPAPAGLALAPPWPSPSRGDVEIAFTIPAESHARVRLYDVGGRFVRELVDGSLPGGPHRLRWDRRTSSGTVARPGLYFLELRLGSERISRRIVLSD